MNPRTLITDKTLPVVATRSNLDLTKFTSSSVFVGDTSFPRVGPLAWNIRSKKGPSSEALDPDSDIPEVMLDALEQLKETIKYLNAVAPTKERLYDKEKDLLFLFLQAVPFQTALVPRISWIIERFLPHRKGQQKFLEEQVAILRENRNGMGRWQRPWQRNLLVLGMDEEKEVRGAVNEV